MPAASYNLIIEAGANFTKNISLKNPDNSPKDLTGFTFRLQIREYIFSTEFLLEATTENSRIIVNPALGTLSIKFTAAQTSTLTSKSAKYDLEMQAPDASVTRLMEGDVKINPEVTR